MYTLPKDTKITNDLKSNQILNDVIDYNERFRARYEKLRKYYLGKQDIFERKKEDKLSNNKVMVNHAKYITDIATGYLLGNPVDYEASPNEDITAVLDEFDEQTIDDLDNELAKDISIYGVQYEYVYANEDAKPRSCKVKGKNAIIVYDDTVEHNKLFGLIYRKIYKGSQFDHYEIIYCDDKEVRTYKSTSKALTQIGESTIHKFGKVPLIQYKNNSEMLGDFEEVISLIDAYNILQSDRVNDKEQLVDAILVLYGADLDVEQAEELRESRVLSSMPTDSKAEYLVKSLQEGDVDVLRKSIEKDIHKISMVPDMSDENFAGNSSGVAIRYKLLAFEQMTKNKERYMKKGLKERFELYNNFLSAVSKMEIIPLKDVKPKFTRNLPSNDYEISQMINNLTDLVDKYTLISQLSFVDNANDVIEKKKAEDEEEQQENQMFNPFNETQIPDANETQEDNSDVEVTDGSTENKSNDEKEKDDEKNKKIG